MKKKKMVAVLSAVMLSALNVLPVSADCNEHIPGEKYEFDYVDCLGGWKAVDPNYTYDYYYSCSECYRNIDANGNLLEIDYFDADPNAKHIPGDEVVEADYIPCQGGYETDNYYCEKCGQLTDADGNDAKYTQPNGKHTPDLSEVIFKANYTSCGGGYKVDRYFCRACMTVVDAEGNEADYIDGNGKHTPDLQNVYEADYTPCGGGYKEAYYECKDCEVYTDANGTEMEYTDGQESHSLINIPAVTPTYEEEGRAEHWKCSGCGSLFEDAEGESIVLDESELVLEKLEKPATPDADPDNSENTDKEDTNKTDTDKKDNSGDKTTTTKKPTTTKTTSHTLDSVPNTGDESNLMLWFAVVAMSGVFAITVALKKQE